MPTRHHRRFLSVCGCVAAVCLGPVTGPACSQQAPVTVQAEVVRQSTGKRSSAAAKDNSNVVVWFEPMRDPADPGAPSTTKSQAKQPPQLVQRNKTFEPHVLVVEVGTLVQFPNKDPFFHNVFSLFDGKRFDLGLYEAGSSKSVTFSREGVSYIFCDIHPEMSAVVLALSTPLYTIADGADSFVLRDVPPGDYTMHLWVEGVPQSVLEGLTRPVHLLAQAIDLGTLTVPVSQTGMGTHQDKFGNDYDPHAKSPYGP
jgi:plastocyanin